MAGGAVATRRRASRRDHAALAELGRYLGWSTRLPLLSEMDPLRLRVHQAIPLPGDQQAAVGRPGDG
ncbi:MAG TPA: hypothetical protein VHI50_07235 [Micromonosporaceae bacterium]|jgi:hypothetical protein|nr:hypothetical protein [Micromonosporaceae bacterium]